MALRYFILLFILFVFSAGGEPIKVALTTIPHVLEHGNPNAPYNRLVNAIMANTQFDVELDFMPSARANLLLNEQRLDCIFPIIPTQTRAIATTQSVGVNGIKAYLFSTGDVTYQSLAQLEGKVVVYLRGYLFGDVLADNNQIHFFPVSSQKAALGMLQKDRAAAYLDYIPDLKFALDDEEFTSLKYDINAPIIVTNDVMECLSSEKVKPYIEEFNGLINGYRRSQKLETMLDKYYVAVR